MTPTKQQAGEGMPVTLTAIASPSLGCALVPVEVKARGGSRLHYAEWNMAARRWHRTGGR